VGKRLEMSTFYTSGEKVKKMSKLYTSGYKLKNVNIIHKSLNG